MTAPTATPSLRDLRLPDLRFVPVESLEPHEQHDDQRLEPLVRRFREQGVVKNPPIVAPLPANRPGEERYMVLDGANRATAARAAGLPHIVVQVVAYLEHGVDLTTWCHALADFPRAELETALARIDDLDLGPASPMGARAQLARREALAYIRYPDGSVVALHGGRDLHGRNLLLNDVVDVYRLRGPFYRVTTDSIEESLARHPDVTALVVFPHFEPAEILELATQGERLPAGITRHLIRWRALRLNVPIDRLKDGASLDEKNRWLEEWLKEKLANRMVRFYEEPTVLFDE